MTPETLAAGVVAFLFAAVHVYGGRLRFLEALPRSAWLSSAGGVSVAYVFVHVLPELAASQRRIASHLERRLDDRAGLAPLLVAMEAHSYVMALIGLATFFGLERLVSTARRSGVSGSEARREPPTGTFWVHLGSYAVYNALVGYVLQHRVDGDARGLVLYATAMTLHFIVNDQGLRSVHGRSYQHKGRWLLAPAPVAGWVLGTVTAVPLAASSALFAFLAGGVIMNVLKEELPEERAARFGPFAAGAALYTALLLLTR